MMNLSDSRKDVAFRALPAPFAGVVEEDMPDDDSRCHVTIS
jgi:hypothetical protein